MPQKRRGKVRAAGDRRQPGDPERCCVVCGTEFSIADGTSFWPARSRAFLGKKCKGSLSGPCVELEAMEFRDSPSSCMSLYRAIIDGPNEPPYISGVALTTMSLPLSALSVVPKDPSRAVIVEARTRPPHLYAEFHAANVLEPDIHRAQGQQVGYTVHMPCWVLLNRYIGQPSLSENLPVFLRTVEDHWRANTDHWLTYDIVNYDEDAHAILPWVERPLIANHEWVAGSDQHWMGINTMSNPLIIPEIRVVIQRALYGSRERNGVLQGPLVPVEIALMIIDIIYKDSRYGADGIADTQSLLEAFGWHLPDSYWQARCHPRLVFEVADLIKTGQPVDWPLLCFGLETLLCNHEWYYHSGLRNRVRIVHWIEQIRDGFKAKLSATDDAIDDERTE
ncbi:hypothetical protein BO71DRAFT_459886 [Aspergillus ellipticus CBS 707.79]|uniref:Uncharacterized protein n=1 Tax=Aspergillus ellipticus CBS 707.79 TaxID=1448320 RepID=A0A319DM11_9EURO|nr:hypothetical protein BO71DRAFT_459886 [Aspergillus ellipticus CBS 707.79]